MDAVLTTSLEDRNLLASELVGTPIRVVPNGVDTDFFRPGTEDEDPRKLLFTGAMNYAPNADGVAHFCAEILPIIRAVVPEVSLSVVGRDPPPRVQSLARDGVAITGTVPDVRPWMNGAAVFVVPLRVGGGTRLKILEAMASGRPVVSTSLGCEGLDVKDGHNILVADTPAAFAAAVVRCLRDPSSVARSGPTAGPSFKSAYQWDAIGRGRQRFPHRDARVLGSARAAAGRDGRRRPWRTGSMSGRGSWRRAAGPGRNPRRRAGHRARRHQPARRSASTS